MNPSPNTEKPSEVATEKDPRWAAVVARDRGTDGKFYYSVKTTGLYCRPSCASRLAKPENVQFHATCADAEQAGFRPCKRCKPDQPSLLQQHAKKVAEMCRLIEGAEETLKLSELSSKAGLTTFHLHRIFKAATGLTPKAYAAAHRAKRIRNQLTEAVFGAGFNSTGRFYETSDQVLGMTPTNYRAGGAHTDIRFAIGECSLGSILVAQSERGICAILLGDDPNALVRDLQDKFPRANLIGGDEGFEQLVARVVSSKFPLSASIYRSMFAGRRFNRGSGRHSEKYRLGRRQATRILRNGSVCRMRFGPWPRPARRTRWR